MDEDDSGLELSLVGEVGHDLTHLDMIVDTKMSAEDLADSVASGVGRDGVCDVVEDFTNGSEAGGMTDDTRTEPPVEAESQTSSVGETFPQE